MEVPSTSAQLFKEVQCLSVVGDKHHLVTSCASRHCQDVVKNKHFTWNKSIQLIIPTELQDTAQYEPPLHIHVVM